MGGSVGDLVGEPVKARVAEMDQDEEQAETETDLPVGTIRLVTCNCMGKASEKLVLSACSPPGLSHCSLSFLASPSGDSHWKKPERRLPPARA